LQGSLADVTVVDADLLYVLVRSVICNVFKLCQGDRTQDSTAVAGNSNIDKMKNRTKHNLLKGSEDHRAQVPAHGAKGVPVQRDVPQRQAPLHTLRKNHRMLRLDAVLRK
jgi:hypothetical protein